MTMKKYCCIILTLVLVLAGCSTAKPVDSVPRTSETTETHSESTSSNESTNSSEEVETANANCYTINFNGCHYAIFAIVQYLRRVKA